MYHVALKSFNELYSDAIPVLSLVKCGEIEIKNIVVGEKVLGQTTPSPLPQAQSAIRYLGVLSCLFAHYTNM